MRDALDLALRLSDELLEFPLGNCGPSDDPDKQYAYTAAYRDIAVRFVAAVRRIGDADLSASVADLDTSPQYISQAHDLRANLSVVVDLLKEAATDPSFGATAALHSAFLDPEVLSRLSAIKPSRLDPKKLVRMCAELNDAYGRGNYISSALLLRAIINHVPPVFGATTFSQVVSGTGRSVGAVLARLNDDARPIADLHTHLLIRAVEVLPTKNQLETYKPALEILIQEVVSRLDQPTE